MVRVDTMPTTKIIVVELMVPGPELMSHVEGTTGVSATLEQTVNSNIDAPIVSSMDMDQLCVGRRLEKLR